MSNGVLSLVYCLLPISGFTGYSHDDNSRRGCQGISEGNSYKEQIASTVATYRSMHQGVHVRWFAEVLQNRSAGMIPEMSPRLALS